MKYAYWSSQIIDVTQQLFIYYWNETTNMKKFQIIPQYNVKTLPFQGLKDEQRSRSTFLWDPRQLSQTKRLSGQGRTIPTLQAWSKGRTNTTLARRLRSRTNRRTTLSLLAWGGMRPRNGIQRDMNGNVESRYRHAWFGLVGAAAMR